MRLVWNIVKIFLCIFLGLVLLLFIAGLFADPIAKRLLEKQVGQAAEGQYTLQLEQVNVSLLRGNFQLRGIRFETDTAEAGLAPVVVAEANEFSGNGVSWLTFLLEKRLFIDQLYLDGLRLEVKARPTAKGDSQEPFRIDQLDIYPHLKEHIHKLHLKDLGLNDIDFTLINAGSQDTLNFSAARLDMHSEDVLIDADKLMTSERTFYATEIDVDGEDLAFSSGGHQDWRGNINRLKIFSEEELMGISLNYFVFLQQGNGQNDTLMFIDLPDFELQELNLRRLQEEETAQIRKIAFSGLDFYHVIDTPSVNNAGAGSQGERATNAFNIKEFNVGDYLPYFANRIELDELELGVLAYRQGKDIKVDKLQLSASDIVMDEQPAFAEDRFLHARKISSQVEALELVALEAGYHFNWDSLYLDVTNGRGDLEVANISLEALENTSPEILIQAQIAGLSLDSLDTRSLDEGVLRLSRLALQQPRLSMQLQTESSGEESNASFSPPDLYPFLEGQLHLLEFALLEMNEGSLELSMGAGSQAGKLNIPVFHIAVQDLLLDSSSAYAGDRVLHSRDIRLGVGSLYYRFPGQANSLQLGALNLSTAGQYLNFRDIHYSTGQGREDPAANDQLESINSKAFSLRGVDYQRLLLDRDLFLTSLKVEETEIALQSLPDSLPPQPEANRVVPADTGSRRLASLKLGEMLPAFLKTVQIEDLDISALSLRQPQRLGLENLYMQASTIHMDARTAFADNRFLHATTLQTGFDTLWVVAGNPAHEVQARDFSFVADKGIGQLSIAQVNIYPQEKPMEKPWLKARLPSLNIPQIDLRNLPEGQLSIDHIHLKAPELLAYMPPPDKDKKGEQKASPPDLYPLIAPELKSLRIGSFDLTEGSLRIAGLGGSYFGMDIPEVNVQLQEVDIAEGNAFLEDRVLHSRKIRMDLEQLTYLFPDRVYFLQLGSANMNTATKTINANGLRYMYGETYEKILEGKKKDDVYRLLNDKIQVDGVDFKKLFGNEGLWADLIRVQGMDLYIYKDKNKPEDGRIKPMPREMVMNIGLPLSIRQLNVKDAGIIYEEMTEDADIAGLVAIDDLSVDIQNISNVREVLRKDQQMKINGRGRLMGEGYFDSRIDVPMLGGQNVRVRGSLDTLDMAHLNRITRYNSRLAIESGILYQARWDFEAGYENSFGDFEVSYADLQVQLSSKDSPDTTGVIKDVGSFLGNLIVVDSNIAESKSVEPKKVKFEGERDKQKSFFNYYIQSLIAGLMEAIGVPFQ